MLLSKTAIAKWRPSNKKWYQNKNYTYTKTNELFDVKVKDLMDNSASIVDVKCDNCNKIFTITWDHYNKCLRPDGKYYCKTCYQSGISFYDWCIENNKQDLLDRWDNNLNKLNPKDIAYQSNKKYYFKCLNNPNHHSEQIVINKITTRNHRMICKQCNSFAQYLINAYGENALNLYWSNKNTVNPWEISHCSGQYVWIKCQNKDYHDDYKITCANFNKGKRCPYCSGHKVHKLDSLGILHPEALDIWSDKNKKSVYEYMPTSNKKVYWKCSDKKHKDYFREINNSIICEFRCPKCIIWKGEKRIEDWLIFNQFTRITKKEYYKSNNINKQINKYYIVQMKFNNLVGINNGLLSYDFYLPDYNLLIENQGEQHEKFCKRFHKSKKDFEKQQEHDRRKKQYTIDNNIKFLEIWYWDYDNIENILEKGVK